MPYRVEKRESDEELILACREGDRRAWETLVYRYRSLIYAITYNWYGLPEEDAADVFQEVCCTLLKSLDEIDKPQSLAAWLTGVAVRKCRNLQSLAASRGRMLEVYPQARPIGAGAEERR